MNLKNGKTFRSKYLGTGPSSYEKRIYRAAVSQRLRNTDLDDGSYEHYFKTCSLLKITLFREVPPFSLVSKNLRSNGRIKKEAAGASETPVLMYWAAWLYTPQENTTYLRSCFTVGK